MTSISQNRPIFTFHIKGLFGTKVWTARSTVCQLYFSKRARLGRFNASLCQNFWLPSNTPDLCERNKHSGTHGKSCSRNGNFFHCLRSGHNLVSEFQGKSIELPFNHHWEVTSAALDSALHCLWNVGQTTIGWKTPLGPSLTKASETSFVSRGLEGKTPVFSWGLAQRIKA